MLRTAKKQKIVQKHRLSDTDTGSSAVQIAILTARIKELAQHLKTHRKDNHSRRGLLKMVAKRKSLLEYLKRRDTPRYETLLGELNIRISSQKKTYAGKS
jgi:small subunit ribosomal protein S15